LVFARLKALRFAFGSRQVIADFDFTLTSFHVNGQPGSSCHGVIEYCGLLPGSYHEETQALKAHYYPLEVDHSLSHDDRVRFMVEWVEKAHSLMVDTKALTKEMIRTGVAKANIALRRGHAEVFRLLQEKRIPLLIFSAGIAGA
ncbi:unnamed protein product, partial [Phaeothamnion confervicola]